MQHVLDRTNPLVKPGVIARLEQLQRALPVAILAFVLLYEIGVELWLTPHVASVLGFTLELLVFGLFGAVVTWVTLEWVRRFARHEAESAHLAARRNRLLAIITADSADAIFMLGPRGVIQTWNRGAEQFFGYAPHEVIGKHYAMLLPPALQAPAELERVNQELAAHGYIRNAISQRVTKDGRLLTVELTQTLLRDENGEVFGSSAILRDVTERERIQQQIRELNHQLEVQVAQRTQALSQVNTELRHRQHELEKANSELKQLDELKSEFVSLVSHELRAPLANISGSLQLLLTDDETPALTTSRREMLTLANEQVDRLARLVKGILGVSRIEAGELPLTPKAFNLLTVIDRVLEQWQVCDPEHVWRGPERHNLPYVWADPDRVEEVLINLLDNAYKYSRAGSAVQVSVYAKQDRLITHVSDQGEGISSEELSRIFDKFHRVERGDARQTYGYGLGLYLSRKLVESMGGALWAESEVGRGSTFSFSLPLAGQHPAQVGAGLGGAVGAGDAQAPNTSSVRPRPVPPLFRNRSTWTGYLGS